MSVRIRSEGVQALSRTAGVGPGHGRARPARETSASAIDRGELRRAYRPDEEQVVAEHIRQARSSIRETQREAAAVARALVKGVRGHKASGWTHFSRPTISARTRASP